MHYEVESNELENQWQGQSPIIAAQLPDYFQAGEGAPPIARHAGDRAIPSGSCHPRDRRRYGIKDPLAEAYRQAIPNQVQAANSVPVVDTPQANRAGARLQDCP